MLVRETSSSKIWITEQISVGKCAHRGASARQECQTIFKTVTWTKQTWTKQTWWVGGADEYLRTREIEKADLVQKINNPFLRIHTPEMNKFRCTYGIRGKRKSGKLSFFLCTHVPYPRKCILLQKLRKKFV